LLPVQPRSLLSTWFISSSVLRKAVPILACLAPLCCAAQADLSGTVTNARLGVALPEVAVFVPELHIGVRTDSAGHFLLHVPQPGRFTVQFTLTGRESRFADIDVSDKPITLDMVLRPSQMELQEVDIVGAQLNAPRESSRKVEMMSVEEMRERGSFNLTDAVAKLPGVSQLTTGIGISKPVIRGLYGNRVQVNTFGQRFDNQQWQDEHGLGLSDLGIDRVEVIKGPAALQYGSDALGGVLNVIEEKPAPVGTTEQNVHLSLMSNTRGGSISYGIKKSTAKMWWRLAAGADSHGDYSSGGDQRVLNSRFAMYNAKASVGWCKGHWTTANHVQLSFGQFGFVFDTLARSIDDARASRSFEGPHHQVLFGILSSENTFYGDRTKWKVNAGWTANQRQEQEGGNKISLDMLLNSGSGLVQATTTTSASGSWTNGISLLYQNNTNLGSRIIVPDATTLEGSIYSYYRQRLPRATIEGGVRFDDRAIHTLETLDLNPPGAAIEPFDKSWTVFNGSVGVAWDPVEHLNLKANISSGYRSGNLAELSSNGLHEGTARYEIGDTDLRLERDLGAELGVTWEWKEQVTLSATAYRNQFQDYIYLAPTGEEHIGFMIYRFLQTDALLQGGEGSIDLHPKALKKFDATVSYALLDASKGDGTPLPFIPANRLTTELKFSPTRHLWFRGGVVHVAAQDRPAAFETATPAFTLINLYAGTELKWNGNPFTLSLFCTNLTDEKYVDHLSRFKYFNLYDIGRNVGVSFALTF
jgi:iron complex outermembrane receptor protein